MTSKESHEVSEAATMEQLRGRVLLAISEHGITAEQIVRIVGGDALPYIARAIRGQLAVRTDYQETTRQDLARLLGGAL